MWWAVTRRVSRYLYPRFINRHTPTPRSETVLGEYIGEREEFGLLIHYENGRYVQTKMDLDHCQKMYHKQIYEYQGYRSVNNMLFHVYYLPPPPTHSKHRRPGPPVTGP